MLTGFLTSALALNFSRENSTIASGEVNTILFITVIFLNALNIPFESEQKQKFQVTKSPPVLQVKRKYSLTLDNFSLSCQQLILN